MRRRQRTIAWIVLAVLLLSMSVASAGKTPTPEPTATPTEAPKEYGPVYYSVEKEHEAMHTDAFGNEILLAGSACANGVLRFTPGKNRDAEVTKSEMEQILGWPDYNAETGQGALKLGVGGSVILDFNAVIRDSAGVFLHVFTTGTNSDQMTVSLSADAVKWYEVEMKNTEFTGADKYTNIPASVKPRYVKITDRGQVEGGIGIDAVVIFAPESLTKEEAGTKAKVPIYEQVGLTRKAVFVICGTIGGLFFVWVVLFAIRRYNIHQKKRKLQVVYSEEDGGRPAPKKGAAKRKTDGEKKGVAKRQADGEKKGNAKRPVNDGKKRSAKKSGMHRDRE